VQRQAQRRAITPPSRAARPASSVVAQGPVVVGMVSRDPWGDGM
jgi:hypothetical protein